MAKILVVDDAAFMRMMIKDILTKNGYEVAGEAENGAVAVSKYSELKPDLVLMDITMPEMNGIDALKMIREYDPQAKVVLITAAGQIEQKEQAMEYGATAFITKPYDNQDILDAIAKCLEE